MKAADFCGEGGDLWRALGNTYPGWTVCEALG